MKKILFTLLFLVFALTSVACVCATSDANNCTIVDDSINTISENVVADNVEVEDKFIAEDNQQNDVNDESENDSQIIPVVDVKNNINVEKCALYTNDNKAGHIGLTAETKDYDIDSYVNSYKKLMDEKAKNTRSNPTLVGKFSFWAFVIKLMTEKSIEDTLIIASEVYNICAKTCTQPVYHCNGEHMTPDDVKKFIDPKKFEK